MKYLYNIWKEWAYLFIVLIITISIISILLLLIFFQVIDIVFGCSMSAAFFLIFLIYFYEDCFDFIKNCQRKMNDN